MKMFRALTVMVSVIVAASVAVLGSPAVAQAKEGGCPGEVLTHPAKVKLCLPVGWFKEEKGGILRIKNQKTDWGASIRVEPVDAKDADAALAKLDSKIADLVTVTWGKPKQISKDDASNPNKMDGFYVRGPGKRKDNGADVGVLAAVVVTPAKKVLLVSLIAEAKWIGDEKNAAAVSALLDSLQPMD